MALHSEVDCGSGSGGDVEFVFGWFEGGLRLLHFTASYASRDELIEASADFRLAQATRTHSSTEDEQPSPAVVRTFVAQPPSLSDVSFELCPAPFSGVLPACK